MMLYAWIAVYKCTSGFSKVEYLNVLNFMRSFSDSGMGV